MPTKCELTWCRSDTQGGKWFCNYHWDKLSAGRRDLRDAMTAFKPVKNNDWIISDRFWSAFQEAFAWLTTEHNTLVDCPKCKGRGINMGHSSYLRGKTCSWCDNGKKAKIYCPLIPIILIVITWET